MGKLRLKIDIWRLVIELLIISIFFENVKIVSVMGTAFKPTHIVFLMAILAGIYQRYVPKRDMAAGVLFLLLPCLPLYRINDKMEWFKSYVIYAMLLFFLIFAFRRFVVEFKKNYKHYIKILVYVIAFTQVLGVIQFICMNFLNFFFLRDVFGTFEYQRNIFNMANGFYRSYSVYHEPSFFGLVTITSVTVLFTLGKQVFSPRQYNILIGLCILAVFVSLSASCLIIFLILLIMHQFVENRDVRVKIISIMALGIVLFVLALSTNLLSPVMRLFTEVNRVNSSGYERITTQWMYVVKTLQNYPLLGRGLGQEGNVDAVGTIGMYSSINNSLAGVVVNFGLGSIFIYGTLIINGIKRVMYKKKWILICMAVFGIYASTGAYVSVDTFNMVVILVTTGNMLE